MGRKLPAPKARFSEKWQVFVEGRNIKRSDPRNLGGSTRPKPTTDSPVWPDRGTSIAPEHRLASTVSAPLAPIRMRITNRR